MNRCRGLRAAVTVACAAVAAAAATASGCATGDIPPLETPAAPTQAAAAAGRAAPDDGDLAGVVPDGAETLIELDVAQLRASPWSQRLVATSEDERAARTAAQGFDEIADVDRALFAVSEGTGAAPATLTVAQGRFDPARIAAAQGAGWRAGSWRGSRLWERQDQALVLLTPRTLVRGEPAAVRAAIDCAWGLAADVRASPAGQLRRELTAAGGRPALVAASVITQAMRRRVAEDFALPAGLARAGARLALTGALDLDIVGVLGSERAAADTAHDLQVTLRDLSAQRALAAFGITPFLAGITIAPQGPRVRVHLTLPQEQRDDLAARLAAVLDAIRARPVVPAGGK
jgi:hypothetical protein